VIAARLDLLSEPAGPFGVFHAARRRLLREAVLTEEPMEILQHDAALGEADVVTERRQLVQEPASRVDTVPDLRLGDIGVDEQRELLEADPDRVATGAGAFGLLDGTCEKVPRVVAPPVLHQRHGKIGQESETARRSVGKEPRRPEEFVRGRHEIEPCEGRRSRASEPLSGATLQLGVSMSELRPICGRALEMDARQVVVVGESVRHRDVELGPRLFGQPSVRALPDECVGERPGVGIDLLGQVGALRIADRSLHVDVLAEKRLHQRQPEAHPLDGCDAEHPRNILRAPVESRLEERAHGRRRLGRIPIIALEFCLGGELLEEQRVALGGLHHAIGDQALESHELGSEGTRIGRIERSERHRERPLHASAPRASDIEEIRPGAAQQQHGAARPSSCILDEIDQGRARPVHVVDRDDHGLS